MTADPHTTNSAPRKALSAPLAASTPLAGASRRPERLCGPQEGIQRLDRGLEPATPARAEYWATEELPGWAWDDEPPDDEPELRIHTVDVSEEYL